MNTLYEMLKGDYKIMKPKISEDEWILEEYLGRMEVNTDSFDSIIYILGVLERREEYELKNLVLQRYGTMKSLD